MASVTQIQTANSAPTAGVQIMPVARAGYLHLVKLSAGAGADATLTVYDNAGAASGTVLDEFTVPAKWTNYYDWLGSQPFKNGLFIVVVGAGATARLSWE